MIQTPEHICSECGMAVEVPDWDETQPFYKYMPRWDRAVLKHAWQHHREDFPPRFKSFSQFMRWITTPEGGAWDEKQGVIMEAEQIMREGRRGL